jgi:hypothetical protein
MRVHPTIAAALLGFLFAPVVGCGGGGSDSADDNGDDRGSEATGGDRHPTSGDNTRESYVAAFTDSFDNPYATAEDKSCMGEATVDVLGIETLRATGTPDDVREAGGGLQTFGIQLDEAIAGALFDALDACVEMRTIFFGDDEAVSPGERSCSEASIPDDVFRAFMISTYTSPDGFSDDPDLEAQVSAALDECSS